MFWSEVSSDKTNLKLLVSQYCLISAVSAEYSSHLFDCGSILGIKIHYGDGLCDGGIERLGLWCFHTFSTFLHIKTTNSNVIY